MEKFICWVLILKCMLCLVIVVRFFGVVFLSVVCVLVSSDCNMVNEIGGGVILGLNRFMWMVLIVFVECVM